MRFKWSVGTFALMYNSASDADWQSSDSEQLADGSFPPMDIIETEDYVHIWLDLPGVCRDDVYIYSKYDQLVIEGIKRPCYPDCNNRRFICAERQYRPFRRIFTLNSPVDIDMVVTQLTDGVLHIKWEK